MAVALDVADLGRRFTTATCKKQNGAAGAIVDGATRDAPDVRASGFPTFVRGLSPVKSQWDLKTASINEPVMLGLVQVNPGDIIFAEETTVTSVIPVAKKADRCWRRLEDEIPQVRGRQSRDARRAHLTPRCLSPRPAARLRPPRRPTAT